MAPLESLTVTLSHHPWYYLASAELAELLVAAGETRGPLNAGIGRQPGAHRLVFRC